MFKSIYELKPDIDSTVRLAKKTYLDALNRKGGNVSLRVLLPSDVDIYERFNLKAYDYINGLDKYADDLCMLLSESLKIRAGLDDNMIPAVFPILGIGDYSAFVAGDIIFDSNTSWSKPVLPELRAYKDLPLLGESVWYKRFLSICELILKRSEGSGIPFMRGFFSPLDLLASLRGDDIYTDFYDEPDLLHDALDYCAESIIKFAQDLYSLVRKYLKDTQYGTFFIDGMINMSEDISCMISAELYREFSAPHTQKVIDSFGMGFMHCHSRAMYLVKEICSLKNVVHLWLATDPQQPRPIDHVKRLVDDANGVCLAIDCLNFSEIEKNYEDLCCGNFSICLPVKDLNEGMDTIHKFKRLSE